MVLLAAGEMVQGGGELRFGDHAKVRLQAVAQPHRALGRAAGDHLHHLDRSCEGLHRGVGRRGGDDEIDVAVGLCVPADAPGDLGAQDARDLADPLEQLLGDAPALVERLPRLARLRLSDAVEDELLGALAEALQAPHAALAGDALEVVEVRYVQFADEDGRLARAEPWHAHQVERAERELLAEVVEEAQVARSDELGDLFRDGLADPVHLGERSLLHTLVETARRGGVGGKRLEGVGAELVGAHLEGVLSLDLQELRDLSQSLGDLARRHGGGSLISSFQVARPSGWT